MAECGDASKGLPTYSHSHAEKDRRHAAEPGLDARDGIHGPPNSVPEGRSRKKGGEDEASAESCMHPIIVTSLNARSTLNAVPNPAHDCRGRSCQKLADVVGTEGLT